MDFSPLEWELHISNDPCVYGQIGGIGKSSYLATEIFVNMCIYMG